MSDRRASRSASLEGRGLPLRGDDIDTDRIMPARFLKAVSFEGLERHVFEDDRLRGSGASVQQFDVRGRVGAGRQRQFRLRILARARAAGSSAAGIHAIVGESFSEIFLGNSAMIGLPCVVADHDAIERLQTLIEQTPGHGLDVDIESGVVTAGQCASKAPSRRRCGTGSCQASGTRR